MRTVLLLIALTLLAVPALALDYGQNVTPDVIFGDGNDNGHFTVVTVPTPPSTQSSWACAPRSASTTSGHPENTFNEFAPGEYYTWPESAPVKRPPRLPGPSSGP